MMEREREKERERRLIEKYITAEMAYHRYMLCMCVYDKIAKFNEFRLA